MQIVYRVAFATFMAVSLAGCTTYKGVLAADPKSHIGNVEVSLAKPVGSPALSETIRTKTLAEASRYGTAGEPKTLRVSVVEMHKKSALKSFLVGDSNYIWADVVVVDGATQAEHGKLQVKTHHDGDANGLLGVVVVAAQTDEWVEETLTDMFARQLLEEVYGSKAAKVARKNPVAPVIQPSDTPAPASGTPVAGKPPVQTPPPRPALAARY